MDQLLWYKLVCNTYPLHRGSLTEISNFWVIWFSSFICKELEIPTFFLNNFTYFLNIFYKNVVLNFSPDMEITSLGVLILDIFY